MKTKIPSPVLARIQLMFQSGATLDEVSAALGLDTSWEQNTQPVPVVQTPVAASVTIPATQPANDTRLPRLDELTSNMESHVSSLLERDDVRDIPAFAGSLDAIFQHVIAIRKEINSPVRNIAKAAEPVTKALPAKKATVVSNNVAIEGPKSALASIAPLPMKVQPPVQKRAQEKLQPIGELPIVAKRRDVAHPFTSSFSGEDAAIQTKAAPPPEQAPVESTLSQPMDAYRDRIALAMNQITTIADEHERDEHYIAVRHS